MILNYAVLTLQALQVIIVFCAGLIFKNYFPSYMSEKGKNLATKEDIKDIVRKTEEVQDNFRREFEKFSSDMKFKYDFYYKQYTELYTKLYSIICQSEYVRRFLLLSDNIVIPFDEEPFLETRKKSTCNSTKYREGNISFEHIEKKIKDGITDFCKKELCELIIAKGEFASQELLKLSVAYRFAYDNYSGNENVSNSDVSDIANNEEFLLIKLMIKSIIKEYNRLRKELKMDYIESELNTGDFQKWNIK